LGDGRVKYFWIPLSMVDAVEHRRTTLNHRPLEEAFAAWAQLVPQISRLPTVSGERSRRPYNAVLGGGRAPQIAGWVVTVRHHGLAGSPMTGGTAMPIIDTATTIIDRPGPDYAVDPAHLAAAAFLARYSGRTLDAYRQDLRGYFNWAVSVGLPALEATRPHIELYRGWLEERGLAASTIDRRLSTVCGFYRFAHIDGRVAANPAQYVRRPQVHPSDARGLDRSELGRFLFAAERSDHDHSALGVLLGLNGLRVSESCDTNIEDLGVERGHRTLRILGKGNKPATVPLVPRTARTIDLAIGERCEGPILRRRDGERLDRRTAHRWVRSIGKRAGLGLVHPHMLRAAFIMAALDAGVPLRDVQLAARHADPRTTTVYDRRRQHFDRHAAYVVVAFITGG
jgi:site-specific recombinase XerD